MTSLKIRSTVRRESACPSYFSRSSLSSKKSWSESNSQKVPHNDFLTATCLVEKRYKIDVKRIRTIDHIEVLVAEVVADHLHVVELLTLSQASDQSRHLQLFPCVHNGRLVSPQISQIYAESMSLTLMANSAVLLGRRLCK